MKIEFIHSWIGLSGLVMVMLLIGLTTGCHRLILPSQTSPVPFSFGVIADCQYCQVEGTGVRKYAKSDGKLRQCVTHFNKLDLAYTIHLGDFIDRDWESFNVVNPIYMHLSKPHLHVLGNHDFSVADDKKRKVPKKMGMPSDYYHFKVDDWRFVVLNGNDISFHAYPKDSKKHTFAAKYYEQNKIDSPDWNGAIGEAQTRWLRNVLKSASRKSENVVLFCHFPIYPENVHNLWNAKEIIEVIENFTCVKAYINGHNHAGNYALKNGIHYLTLKGMVDTEENSYGVIEVFGDSLNIIGYGREESRNLPIGN